MTETTSTTRPTTGSTTSPTGSSTGSSLGGSLGTVVDPHGFSVHHGDVDGVPAVWADLPGDPVTTLMFGVGHEDATPAAAGLTHLVEHLVMRRVGRVAVPHNAESTMRSTSFYAVGAPALRADFVARVCEAVTWVRGVTDDDLDLERQTILAEIGPTGVDAVRDAFSTRYGTAGPGLGAVVHARLLDWTAAEVRETATRWFHRGNAYVTSTTPLPAGLRVPLPDGPPVARPAAPASLLTGRAWCDHESAELVLTGTCAAAAPETLRTLASAVVTDVLHASLRTATGQVYSVAPITMQVGDDDLWTFVLDPGPEAVCDVLVAALDVLERLAEWGPTQDELDRTRTSSLYELELTAMRSGWLDGFASATLRGQTLPTLDEARAVTAAATTAEVRALVRQVADSLLVITPAGHVLHEAAVSHLEELAVVPVDLFPDPQGRTGWALARAVLLDGEHGTVASVLRGGNRFHRGRWFSPARHAQVALLPDRLILQGPDLLWTVPYADMVLVGTDAEGDVEIVTSRGGVLVLSPRLFRGLSGRLADVLDRLPEGVRYRKDRTTAAGAAVR